MMQMERVACLVFSCLPSLPPCAVCRVPCTEWPRIVLEDPVREGESELPERGAHLAWLDCQCQVAPGTCVVTTLVGCQRSLTNIDHQCDHWWSADPRLRTLQPVDCGLCLPCERKAKVAALVVISGNFVSERFAGAGMGTPQTKLGCICHASEVCRLTSIVPFCLCACCIANEIIPSYAILSTRDV